MARLVAHRLVLVAVGVEIQVREIRATVTMAVETPVAGTAAEDAAAVVAVAEAAAVRIRSK